MPSGVYTRGTSVEDRVFSLVNVEENGCWILNQFSGPRGYCTLKIQGKTLYAHRWAYEYWIGPIPEGLHIDHVKARGCTSIRCINPDHLEAVTQAVNNQRRCRKYRPRKTRTT